MTARMRWRSVSGQLVTFEDRRPEAVAAAEREAEEMSGKGHRNAAGESRATV